MTAKTINYDERHFRGRSNVARGEVSGETRFIYHQRGDLLWGEYRGGSVAEGHLLGTVHPDGRLSFVYHHRNTDGVLMAGQCESVPRWEGARLVMDERWRRVRGSRQRCCPSAVAADPASRAYSHYGSGI